MVRDNPQDEGPAPPDDPFVTGRSILVGDIYRDGSHQSVMCDESNDIQNNSEDAQNNGNIQSSGESLRPSTLASTQSMRQARASATRARVRTDEEALAQCVAEAGLNAFGCVFVEVWALAGDGTKLIRPDGGHWMDPVFAQSLSDESLINDAWRLDLAAPDCAPGTGLAGTMVGEGGADQGNVKWRQIRAMMNDPFLQRGSGKRMERLLKLGIGIVGGVIFSFRDEKGIVLYFSRSKAKIDMLRSERNERYLTASTELIGANYALRKSRIESSKARKRLFREAIDKARKGLLQKDTMAFASMVLDEEKMAELKTLRQREESNPDFDLSELHRVDKQAVQLAKWLYRIGASLVKRANSSRRKWRGAKLHGPPRQTLSDCIFSFVGVYVTMLTVLKIGKTVRVDGKYEFDPGWYSSTLCIVYALTPAPVGQPRQIVAAHLWNMLVGLACREIPTGGFGDFSEWSDAGPDAEYGLPLIWVQALAVALGVSGQAFIGILHPPATGMSMAFTKPQWTFHTILSVMLVDVTITIISMMYLNLSEKKQFPLYWLGLGWEGSDGSVGVIKSARSRASSIVMSGKKVKGEQAV